MSTLGSGSGPDSLATRVEEIVRAAEREAEALQRELGGAAHAGPAIPAGPVAPAPDAAAAERRLDDLHVVVDDLVLRAEAARAALVELEAAIAAARHALPAEAAHTVHRPAASAAVGDAPAQAPPAPVTEPPCAATPAGVTPYMDQPDVIGARLVAMEMAFAGRPRKEVERYLREEFRITETSTLLNDVFGAGRDTWRA